MLPIPLIKSFKKFILLNDGVTVRYLGSTPGDTGTYETGGTIYTAVDNSLLTTAVTAGTSMSALCTTLVTSMSNLFNDKEVVGSVVHFDTSNVISMLNTFTLARPLISGIGGFNQNISTWNVSNVTNMNGMFQFCRFNQNISTWNVSSVTNMSNIFRQNPVFNQNIGSWNVSSVTTMYRMFEVSGFNNGGSSSINDWNVSNVATLSEMFKNSPFNQNIGSWITTSATGMAQMFQSNSNFNQNIGSWNTGNVTLMGSMFNGASNFNQNIGSWNTGNVIGMLSMFSGASAFNQNLSAWCVENLLSFPNKPLDFDSGATAWVLAKPNWAATC